MGSQPQFEHPNKAFGWAARDQSGLLSPFNFSRRFIHSPLHFYIYLTTFFVNVFKLPTKKRKD